MHLRLSLQLLILALLVCSAVEAKEWISIDLDETLVSAANISNKSFKKAEQLGYKIDRTNKGLRYIVRPGAEKLLQYIEVLDYDTLILTHNKKKYAEEIIESSGFNRYVDRIVSIEDLSKSYNRDFVKYPYHRNKTHKQRPKYKQWTVDFYQAFFKRGVLNLLGNRNIKPYIPKQFTNKYPPVYCARLHIDNSSFNVESPLDFIGIEVTDFYGTELEERNDAGDYIWARELMDDLKSLREIGWIELYRNKYDKEPVQSNVDCVTEEEGKATGLNRVF